LPDGEDCADCAVAGATRAASPRMSNAAAWKTLAIAGRRGRSRTSKTPGLVTPGM